MTSPPAMTTSFGTRSRALEVVHLVVIKASVVGRLRSTPRQCSAMNVGHRAFFCTGSSFHAVPEGPFIIIYPFFLSSLDLDSIKRCVGQVNLDVSGLTRFSRKTPQKSDNLQNLKKFRKLRNTKNSSFLPVRRSPLLCYPHF